MFGFCDHYIHEVVITPKNQIVLIDVSDTPDCGWEGAYAIFDEEEFRDWWEDDNYGDDGLPTPYTIDDIMAWGEDANAFYGWTVVSNHHRTPEAAEKKLRKYVATL